MYSNTEQISHGKVVVDLSLVDMDKFISDIKEMFNGLTSTKTDLDAVSTSCTIISILLEHMVNNDTDNFVDSARTYILEELSNSPYYFKNGTPPLGMVGDKLEEIFYNSLGTFFAPMMDTLEDIVSKLEKTDERFYSFFTSRLGIKSSLYEIEILFQE